MLWLAFHDDTGKRVCRSSGYKVGQEDRAQAVLDALEKRTAEKKAPPVVTGAKASAAVRATQAGPAPALQGMTVQAYGDKWIKGREHRVESAADEHGRLKNHVYRGSATY